MKINTAGGLFSSPEALLDFMQSIQYSEFIALMSPIEVVIHKFGSCHDQAMLEMQELQEEGLNPIAKFIMSVDEDMQGQETHSFVYYPLDGKWYWFENAWEDVRGIREYENEQELIDSVMFAFGRRNFGKLYIADLIPSEHSVGEDLQTFVDICMNSAQEYQYHQP